MLGQSSVNMMFIEDLSMTESPICMTCKGHNRGYDISIGRCKYEYSPETYWESNFRGETNFAELDVKQRDVKACSKAIHIW